MNRLGVVALLWLALGSATACAAKPDCEEVARLLFGKKGQRSKYFAPDAGASDVLVLFGKEPGELTGLPVEHCRLPGVKFHGARSDVPVNSRGYELNIIDEGKSYLVILRWTNLRPLNDAEGVLHEGTTDSERVPKQ